MVFIRIIESKFSFFFNNEKSFSSRLKKYFQKVKTINVKAKSNFLDCWLLGSMILVSFMRPLTFRFYVFLKSIEVTFKLFILRNVDGDNSKKRCHWPLYLKIPIKFDLDFNTLGSRWLHLLHPHLFQLLWVVL